MNHLTVLRRYLCLLRQVQPPFRYPNKKQIQDAWEDEGILHSSERTLERDIKKLKNEYGASVVYDSRNKGYYLHTEPDEDISDFIQFFRLLERRERMEFLGRSIDPLSAARFLILEENHYFQGNNYLPIIWNALRQKRVIKFWYKAYYKEAEFKERTVEPGLILEDRNRWYLVGREMESGKLKTFGLDRLQKPVLTDNSFSGDPALEYREQKPHIIGITYRPNRPIHKVILRFNKDQSPYIKSLPIHPTQVILEENEKGLTISINVVLNYELEQEILSHGERVEVLEPLELRETIMNRIQQLIQQYPRISQ